MDDVTGLFRVEGHLTAISKRFHSNPIQLRADFQDDGDWIAISKSDFDRTGGVDLRDFSVIVYLPEEGLEPISGSYRWKIFDADRNELDSGSEKFRIPFAVRDYTDATYLQITADAIERVDPVTSEVIQVPAYYRVGLGQGGDAVGDSIGTAVPYRNNIEGVVGGNLRDSSDVDFFSVAVQPGVEYEFWMYGEVKNSSEQSTLVDPQLDLYSQDGELLVAGVRPTPSKSERIVRYTPSQSETVYLKAYTNAEGYLSRDGYILRSKQFDDDDMAASQVSRGVALPGSTLTRSIDFEGDVDWARLQNRRFFTYQITTPVDMDQVSLRDQFGRELTRGRFDDDQILGSAGTEVWVSLSGEEADFHFEALDLHEDQDLDQATLGHLSAVGAIDSEGDADLFRVRLVPFVDHRLVVEESEVQARSGDLVVEHLDAQGKLLDQFMVSESEHEFLLPRDGSNLRRHPTLASVHREDYFRVRSENGTETGYQLTFEPISSDTAGGGSDCR